MGVVQHNKILDTIKLYPCDGEIYHLNDFSYDVSDLSVIYELAYADIVDAYKRGDLAGLCFYGNSRRSFFEAILGKLNNDISLGLLQQYDDSLPLEVSLNAQGPIFQGECQFNNDTRRWEPASSKLTDYSWYMGVNTLFYEQEANLEQKYRAQQYL